MNSTKKLYFQYPYKTSCRAIIEEINFEKTAIRLDQTVAFPEGGGQASDSGTIVTSNSLSIPFANVQKVPGRNIFLNDFPVITVDNPIYHFVPAEFIKDLKVRMEIQIKIDIYKRASTATYHSATHLVLLGVEKIRPGATNLIKGCSIKEDGARLDYAVKERFTEEDITRISFIANNYVERNLPIEVYPHPKEPEAWYWKCDNEVIPCGGTHIPFTWFIGCINVKRRRMAKDLERLLIQIPNLKAPVDLYME